MRREDVIGYAFILATALLPGPAGAQQSQNMTWCKNLPPNRVSRDLQISSCTTVILSGTEPALNLTFAFWFRGYAYQLKAQYNLAIADYSEFIRQQPTLPLGWSFRCEARASIGQFDAALSDCNEALRLRANHASSFDSRGFAYFKMGKYDLAISDYSVAWNLSPRGDILYGRGLAKLKKGDTTGGNADIEAAKKTLGFDIVEQSDRYGVK